jgi:hypothetical protein
MKCPTCNREITPEVDASGVTRGFCDCAGFRRPVIEILPALIENSTPAKEKKNK